MAKEIAEDLNRYQLGEPIKGRPVGIIERALKWAERHRSSTALALLGTFSLFLIATFALWRESRLKYEAFFHVSDLETAPIGNVLGS